MSASSCWSPTCIICTDFAVVKLLSDLLCAHLKRAQAKHAGLLRVTHTRRGEVVRDAIPLNALCNYIREQKEMYKMPRHICDRASKRMVSE